MSAKNLIAWIIKDKIRCIKHSLSVSVSYTLLLQGGATYKATQMKQHQICSQSATYKSKRKEQTQRKSCFVLLKMYRISFDELFLTFVLGLWKNERKLRQVISYQLTP